jgi:tubulin polyglutamylase TTLL1
VRAWLQDKELEGDRESYVISRYLTRPLLIGGKKFDLRLYVLVLSYSPLRALLHEQGFARFCIAPYSPDDEDLNVHLTNVAVQKKASDYNERHGGKWTMTNLHLYIESVYGKETCDALMSSIEFVLSTSLRAVQATMSNDPHCFEMYGYDVLIDEDLKPWLIEVNASPSLSSTTRSDERLKTKLIDDTLNVVLPPGFPHHHEPFGLHRRKVVPPQGSEYRFIIDEASYAPLTR